MLTEPNFDKELLRTKIEENYRLVVINLLFVQGGEASWGYKVETNNKQSYFFKIHTSLENYKERFDLTYKLFNSCGIQNITHPLKTSKGELVFHLDKYPCALFNFISGHNASQEELNEKQRFALGELVGRIHKAKEVIGDFVLKEDFKYGDLDQLLENIEKVPSFIKDESPYRKKVAQLLLENKEKVLKRINELQAQGDKLRGQSLDFVVCHGEPHNWNTMVDKEGEVFLIDWDDCLFAPKEKDLNMIKGDPLKLEGYRSAVGEFEINEEVIHYYNMEWNISEIEAWSSKILYENIDGDQNQHDLELFIRVLEELNYI